MTETVTHKSVKGKVRKPKVIAESGGGAVNAEKPHKETEGRSCKISRDSVLLDCSPSRFTQLTRRRQLKAELQG